MMQHGKIFCLILLLNSMSIFPEAYADITSNTKLVKVSFEDSNNIILKFKIKVVNDGDNVEHISFSFIEENLNEPAIRTPPSVKIYPENKEKEDVLKSFRAEPNKFSLKPKTSQNLFIYLNISSVPKNEMMNMSISLLDAKTGVPKHLLKWNGQIGVTD